MVTFFDGSNWVELARHSGLESELSTYTANSFILPVEAYHQGFKLRFASEASVSADEWFIDDIGLAKAGPIADFIGSPTTGPMPLTVQFTDQSAGTITSRLWDFGDGQTSTTTNPSHTYQNPGTYTVKLTVTGPDGSDTQIRTDYIQVDTTEILHLAQARSLANGTVVTVVGMVTRAKGRLIRIQDETAGIAIFEDSGAFFEAVADGDVFLGDSLRITGELSEFNSLKRIINSNPTTLR